MNIDLFHVFLGIVAIASITFNIMQANVTEDLVTALDKTDCIHELSTQTIEQYRASIDAIRDDLAKSVGIVGLGCGEKTCRFPRCNCTIDEMCACVTKKPLEPEEIDPLSQVITRVRLDPMVPIPNYYRRWQHSVWDDTH